MDLTKEKDVNELLDLKLAYQPLRDDVVLNLPTDKEIEALNKTASGLTISANNSNKKVREEYVHTVLAVGPDCKYVKVGDKVLLKPLNGGHAIISLNKKGYIQTSEFAIYGKVNENKEDKA